MKFRLIKRNNPGFALLFSVLVSSLLLTIGLSIFNIALKELAISTAARESVHAFFAADSGRECALYWDIKRGKIPTLIDYEDGPTEIACGGSDKIEIEPNNDGNIITGPLDSEIGDRANNKPVLVVAGDDDESNFYVTIKKERLGATPLNTDPIVTTVTSRGYNANSDDRVERAIEQTY